jgi:hypothetical protein
VEVQFGHVLAILSLHVGGAYDGLQVHSYAVVLSVLSAAQSIMHASGSFPCDMVNANTCSSFTPGVSAMAACINKGLVSSGEGPSRKPRVASH